MVKFIFLTFGFLALVFYEMSGGNEFDAEALRLSRIDTAPMDTAPQTRVAAVETQAPRPSATPEIATVTRASFSLSDVNNEPQAKPVQKVVATAVAAPEEPKEPEQVLILPSLVQSTDTRQASLDASVTEEDTSPVLAADVRAVTGNRVNVRGGPGTNYDVVNRLTRGQEVEILSDPGTGWVKLRPVDGDTVGWMADFLLTSG